jgi:hypothetical protein
LLLYRAASAQAFAAAPGVALYPRSVFAASDPNRLRTLLNLDLDLLAAEDCALFHFAPRVFLGRT